MSNLVAGFFVATSVMVPQSFNGHTQSMQVFNTQQTQSIHQLSTQNGMLEASLPETKTEPGDSTPRRGDGRRE